MILRMVDGHLLSDNAFESGTGIGLARSSAKQKGEKTILAAMERQDRPEGSDVESIGSRPPTRRRILVAYFSWSGNTRQVARQIRDLVGGDLFEIVSADKYPGDYNECVRQAKRELDASYLPKLRSEVEHVESYDVVIIGYPNWWGTIPRPVASFLSKCNSHRKTIAPFCTHGGDRLGRSVEDIGRLCPQSTILEGLALQGRDVRDARDKLSEWLHKVGLTERP